MRDEHPDGLQKLGEELRPTPEEVAALIDGSLEAERDAPETLPLLAELPSPTAADVRALNAAVVDALDHPPARRTPWWAVAGVAALVAIAAAALLSF